MTFSDRADGARVVEVLARFGSTGRIAGLHAGARLPDLVSRYGTPWDIGRVNKKRRWPHLYSYGDVEFAMCRCRLVGSVTVPTWRGTLELPGESRALPTHVTYAELTAALSAAGCEGETLRPTAGQYDLRTMTHGVVFTFAAVGPVLHVAGAPPHPHECMPASEAETAFANDFPPEVGPSRLTTR